MLCVFPIIGKLSDKISCEKIVIAELHGDIYINHGDESGFIDRLYFQQPTHRLGMVSKYKIKKRMIKRTLNSLLFVLSYDQLIFRWNQGIV